MRLFTAAIAVVGLCMCSCSRPGGPSPDAPHATVMTKDGKKISGAVVASSAAEITISGDDQQVHTIPVKNVRSVEYEDAVIASTAEGPARTTGRPHPTQAAIKTKTYQLPAGTEISVRNDETIDSGKATEGQTYAAEVTADVTDAAGDVVIPRGSNAQIVIRSVTKGGKIKGASDLVLDLQAVSVEGQKYQLSTQDLEQKGRDGVGANKRTATFTGGGAAVGAIIGAIAGGGKGAAIGAGAGAGAGAATQILTKGSIKVPAETVLTFKLDKPLRVTAAK